MQGNDTETERLERLILAIARGHAECLDGVYLLAGKRMFAVARSVTGAYGAEDAVHDSLIKIARFARKYERGTNPFGWVLKITRNTALDYLRKNGRTVSTEEFYNLSSLDYSPDRRDEAILLEQAMAKLGENERRAVYLKYYLDMTVREIAAETGMSKSAAQRLIEKAEKELKNLLCAGQDDG